MSLFKKYSETYEGGHCAYGYEYIESFQDRNGVYHRSYCRRIKRTWHDPEEQESKLKKKSEQESKRRALEIIAESESDNNDNPSPPGDFGEKGI